MQTKTPERSRAIRVEKSITIDKPKAELYSFWRDFRNLPRVMDHLESVKVKDQTRSRWVAKGPAGKRFEWESEVITEIENEQIDWQTLPGAQVPSRGSVFFKKAPHERGTEVKVIFHYEPPGGSVGEAFAKLFGEEPSRQVADGLRRFKQLMETGEIATVHNQPYGV
jgi:uncharacterized membrane protein